MLTLKGCIPFRPVWLGLLLMAAMANAGAAMQHDRIGTIQSIQVETVKGEQVIAIHCRLLNDTLCTYLLFPDGTGECVLGSGRAIALSAAEVAGLLQFDPALFAKNARAKLDALIAPQAGGPGEKSRLDGLPALTWTVESPPAAGPRPLFAPAPAGSAAKIQSSDKDVLRSRLMVFDAAGVLSGSGVSAKDPLKARSVLRLNLFDDTVTTAAFTRLDPRGFQDATWAGVVAGARERGNVALTLRDGIVYGVVDIYGRGTYRIRDAGGGLVEVQQIDTTKEDAPAVIPPRALRKPAPPKGPGVQADSGAFIDVLVFYTGTARAGAGGAAQIQAAIDTAVTDANTAYANSGITQRIRCVGKQEVSYTETQNSGIDLDRLQKTADGYLDSIHPVRDSLSADCVVLVCETLEAGIAGRGYQLDSLSYSFAPWAFCVVERASLASKTMTHELGHNMGAGHSRDDSSPGPGLYSYSCGYHWMVSTFVGYRTIMSYSHFGETRISYFSNPSVSYLGHATGISGSNGADNALTLNNTAVTAANWRSASIDLLDDGEAYRSFSPTTIQGGKTLSIGCDVRNVGSGASGAFTVKFYASADTVINTSDYLIGSKSMPSINGGAWANCDWSGPFPASIPDGSYNVGWIIDSQNAVTESNENNNTAYKTGYKLAVGKPDLIDAGQSSNNFDPTVLKPGQTLGIGLFAKNVGTAPSGQFYIKFYLSVDTTINKTGDYYLGSKLMPALDPGSQAVCIGGFGIPASVPLGSYYVGWIIDSENNVVESNESNNTTYKEGKKLTVTNQNICDLYDDGDEWRNFTPATIKAGQTLSVNCDVRNTGTKASGGFYVKFYVSADTVIKTTDYYLGSQLVSSIPPGSYANCDFAKAFPAGIPPGSYYVGWIIDSQNNVIETNETNNVAYKTSIKLTVLTPDRPDLKDDGESYRGFSPAMIKAGQSFTINCDVRNSGPVDSGAYYVKFYVSTDTTISKTDFYLGSKLMPALNAGGWANCDRTAAFPGIPPGYYYVGWIIDSENNVIESNEANNTAYKEAAILTVIP